ncbi:RxLR-like protein [Phytophthora cinnamomi]|uniref:RxLR-like protein n=1 Tax=Phytophthora cinnamomi TaxID=4785 RepID=UPI0035595B39|nr:RxLR-like protein [Phytophthora cinnamomi]
MKATTMAFAVAAGLLPAALGWTDRWDHSKRFNAAGHGQLDCDGESQPASCCICKSIVFEIETQLNNTQNDHDMDVVFRISEEKKQIKYSRSEARILEVLDDVCEQVPLELPGSNHKSKRMLSAACNDFVGEYEDELTRTFFDDFTPAKERVCVSKLQVCPQPDKTSKFEEL